MSNVIIRKIDHYPQSKRYKVKSWKQRHKLVFKKPKKTEKRPILNDYIIQEKFDGSRIQYVDVGDKGYIVNRRGFERSNQYPELQHLAKNIKGYNILDSEIVVLNKKGIDDFGLLARREHLLDKEKIKDRAKKTPATIMVFDILVSDGKDIMNKPLKDRQRILKKVLPKDKRIIEVKSIKNTEENFKKLINKKDVEGAVFKDINSRYDNSRDSKWLNREERVNF